MSTAIVWFRRDLRLADHPALCEAARQHRHIVPVYIHAPHEDGNWSPGEASRWWLHQSLSQLDNDLRERHSRLILRSGDTLETLQGLIRDTGATAVYWSRHYEPHTLPRDKHLKTALREAGCQAQSFNAALLQEPWAINTQSGDPYRVFTPFWRRLSSLEVTPPLPIPETLPGPDTWPDSLPLDALELMPRIPWYQAMADFWTPGEAGAQQRLTAFCQEGLADYSEGRNQVDRDGSSRLSPHLHHGEISPRQVWAAVSQRVGSEPLQDTAAEAFLRELGWREFAHHVLFYFPHTVEQPMQSRFDNYPWTQNPATWLDAWQRGRTGIPLVDAGMRQLWELGWMHNRVRMVVASFLTKNLGIHWLEGDRWFWDTLVDANLASNTMGWQWTAGCGTDAAPYFRVFNPVSQAQKFDPKGEYIARYVPELAHLPVAQRQQPWSYQGRLDYPKPLVDLKQSRARALEGYQQIKN